MIKEIKNKVNGNLWKERLPLRDTNEDIFLPVK